ncbi:LysR family transcriptional regulator [Photobacterium jeanii]|uniref:LysR family transcriptional regulator n=1 Tax=Photobacterium jeanii TaxID=858640 RepID=A0A178K773_9GAMM|nr:LysR substrate-binding domain-containing protein [Photobacterium jeanii]OAN13141.1 LysR family transcriptional regulator [Photobacterium jeanii]PST89293.1 LysR family transcriptional regulator [Photobacterium jeanii]
MKLPPLRAVYCFEAVARCNSFSQAAESLNVTQSAVSHQVKLLEEYLGKPLFVRQGRLLSLTDEGKHYYESIRHALHDIAHASQSIKEGNQGKLRLAMYSTLAVKWLIPRLDDLRQQHPEIDLSLIMVSDDPNFNDHTADCFITVKPPKKHFHIEHLYQERLYPVCSQYLWEKLKNQPLPESLWQYPLLSVTSATASGKEGDDWRLWCKAGDISLPSSVQMHYFSHMLLAAEAARYNQGITFLNHYFMTEEERHHSFVRLPLHDLPTGDDFYFTYKSTRAQDPHIEKLGRWLKIQCAEMNAEMNM